jgi:response regulator RpfG family c-di-GMP phosphodiesterase
MEQAPAHTVLVVDDEEMVGRAVAGILRKMGVECVCVSGGHEALERIRSAPRPFSLILSDQRMTGMSGYELLEKAREISPDTVRFLMTGFVDMAAIIEAVNKGAIHRYISKPWDNTELAAAVADGLRQFDLTRENLRLLKLAREQNTKLYKLNRDLKDRTEERRKTLAQLDREIETLVRREEALEGGSSRKEGKTPGMVSALLTQQGYRDREKLERLYTAVLRELYLQFREAASRCGFEMPGKL